MPLPAGKISSVRGKNIYFRPVEVSDAPFILSLRMNEKLNRYISKVDNDIKKQEEWIYKHSLLADEYYFLGVLNNGTPFGAFRIYDVKGDSFGIGSWIVTEDAPKYGAVEGYFLAHDLLYFKLGFKEAHFDVRKANRNVVSFHLRSGAVINKEDDLNYYFVLSRENYEKNRQKHLRFTCENITYE